jgi:hypothetical protein
VSNSDTSVEPAGDSLAINIPSDMAIAQSALDTYTRVVQDFAKDVLEEASKVEYMNRGDAHVTAEYTSRYFVKASATVLERGATRRRTPWHIILCHILTPILYAAAGIFFSLAFVDPVWYAWAIPVSLAAVAATILIVVHTTSGGKFNG